MDTLSDTLAEVVAGYAGRDLNGDSFLTQNADRTVLTILSVGNLHGQHFAVTSLAVRLVGEHIVIEHDLNDRPLVDALVAVGVPREKIVLAYAGESGSNAA
ncbi:MAG TPA: element excision factor XisI family protein [Chloroflexota bacterium]|nr:element excision factor XisI family protein [Chloroflexota bacterium]